MIRHEIEEQVHAPLRQFLACHGKPGRAAEMFVNNVPSHAIGRSHIVLQLEIGKRSAKIVQQVLVPIGNRNASGTSFPDAHQPHGIEAVVSNGIPFRRRYAAQID